MRNISSNIDIALKSSSNTLQGADLNIGPFLFAAEAANNPQRFDSSCNIKIFKMNQLGVNRTRKING